MSVTKIDPATGLPVIGPRPFAIVLAEIADGDLERRLTSEFAELVRACQDTGKTGKLAVTIGVGVDGKLVRVVADSKVTVPKPSLEGTSFFADDRGGVHVENPNQARLWPSGAKRDGAKVDTGERPARAEWPESDDE